MIRLAPERAPHLAFMCYRKSGGTRAERPDSAILFRCAGLFGLRVVSAIRQGERRLTGDRLRTITVQSSIAIAVVLRLLAPVLLVLLLLLRLGGKDAVIMFGMLKIVFGCHPVTRCIRIPGQLKVLVVNMSGGTPDLHFRPAGIEGPVGVVVLATMRVLRPSAALA